MLVFPTTAELDGFKCCFSNYHFLQRLLVHQQVEEIQLFPVFIASVLV